MAAILRFIEIGSREFMVVVSPQMFGSTVDVYFKKMTLNKTKSTTFRFTGLAATNADEWAGKGCRE